MDSKDLEQIESRISRQVGTFADAVQHKLNPFLPKGKRFLQG
jgi:hypothetical protein